MFLFNRYNIDWKNDTQKTRMLKVLRKSGEIWVFKLIQVSKIAHHTSVIQKLREDWHIIKQRSEFTKNHIHKSFYTLIEDEKPLKIND